MKQRRNSIGFKGEKIANEFLVNKNHAILEINYKFNKKEIDIISLIDNILVFTEVKTRSSYEFGFPEDAVNIKKQLNIKEVAEEYLILNKQYTQIRFDIIGIKVYDGDQYEIFHIEDAFY